MNSKNDLTFLNGRSGHNKEVNEMEMKKVISKSHKGKEKKEFYNED